MELDPLLGALLPGWRPYRRLGDLHITANKLPFPVALRWALALSLLAAHLLSWLWTRRGLRQGAPAVLQRLVHHPWWPLRNLVAVWKLVALVTHDPSASGSEA